MLMERSELSSTPRARVQRYHVDRCAPLIRQGIPMQGSSAQQSESEMNDPRLAGDGGDGFLEAAPDLQNALVLDDFQAAYRQLECGALDQYRGEFVAFLNKQLAGTGPDS